MDRHALSVILAIGLLFASTASGDAAGPLRKRLGPRTGLRQLQRTAGAQAQTPQQLEQGQRVLPGRRLIPPQDAVPIRRMLQSSGGMKNELNAIEMRAFSSLTQDNLGEARKTIADALKKGQSSPDDQISLLYALAYIDKADDEHEAAIKSLQQIERLYDSAQDTPARAKAFLQRRMGDEYLASDNPAEALKRYQKALQLLGDSDATDPLCLDILQNSVSCMVGTKDFAAARDCCQNLLQRAQARLQSSGASVPNLGAYFWAVLEMAQLAKRTDNQEEMKKYGAQLAAVLDQVVQSRRGLDDSFLPLPQRLSLFRQYAGEVRPRSVFDVLWLTSDARVDMLPLIAWRDDSVPTRAALVCVHGLGLENRNFTPFARIMSKRGVAVYALDCRGFGAWSLRPGQEDIDFEGTISDIGSVVSLIKFKHPDLPVFILGESMGGAIALRAGAAYQDRINGVISSVPSAERYQGGKMALSTAIHFLKDPNKPFDIGEQVIPQATSDERLRKIWELNPKAKTKVSPKDLMAFDVFMRRTHHKCKQIDKAPVLVVQGLKDDLVKPQGTYDLFHSVKSADKSMLIIGTAEHLMFETDKQNPLLLDALSAWIDQHKDLAPAPGAEANSKLAN